MIEARTLDMPNPELPDILVEKQVFELATFTTTGGAALRQVRVGLESYGTLNEARDDAILVTHFSAPTCMLLASTAATMRSPAAGMPLSAQERRSTPAGTASSALTRW
jgi:homoserine acetyltransferase